MGSLSSGHLPHHGGCTLTTSSPPKAPPLPNTITWVLGAVCEFGEHTGTQSVAATKFVGWPSDDPAGWSELPVICAVDRSPWEAIGHPASEQGSCLSVTILTAI